MTYNQIRIVKRLLAVVLVCFGGFVSHQLYVSLDKRQSNAEIPLSTEPDDPLAKGVELTQLDSDGKRAFVLRAAESVGRDQESQTFRDVEIEFEAGREGVPLIVTADRCRFDHESSAAHLEGNVVIRDQESLRVETSVLDFRRQPDRVWTDSPVRFFRDDMEGKAGSLYYDVPAVTWNLDDTVEVRLLQENAPPIHIDSKRAIVKRKTSLIQFVDDVVVNQENRFLRCNDLQVYMTEDESAIEHIEAFENVELFMFTPPGRDEPADSQSLVGPINLLDEPGTKRLITEKLEVMYRPGDGTIERMRALDRGNVVFESLPGKSPANDPAMVKTIDGYTLVFHFDEEGRFTKLRGRGGVVMTMRPKDGPEEETRQVKARRLEADFDADTGELTKMSCRRSVEFTRGDVKAEAELGVYDASTEVLTLTESPRLWDPHNNLEADTILIETALGDLEARKGVRSTLNRDSGGESRGIFPTSDNAPVFFVADHLDYRQSEDVAIYTGSARGFQSENRIEADRIELRQGTGELKAEGSVTTVMHHKTPEGGDAQQTTTRSEQFDYRADDRVLRYRRDVTMTTDEMSMTGDNVDVALEPEKEEVRSINAEGEVEIETPNGRAHGDNAKYLPKSEEVQVSGERAWLENGDKLTEGKELTFFLSDDRIFVDGREISRTKSIYASKPRPF